MRQPVANLFTADMGAVDNFATNSVRALQNSAAKSPRKGALMVNGLF
jgi:hypothetical protein